MTLPLAAILEWQVWMISLILLVVTYVLRYALFYVVEKKDTMPQTFIAPKGLISILLFFAIPEPLRVGGIESGILFVVIIATSVIMAWSLIANSKRSKDEDVELDSLSMEKNDISETIELPID
jgi:NhaP-type Na+/H+ or K+/H+ antiporter